MSSHHRLTQVASDDTTHYYLTDGLGLMTALTDADGDVVNAFEYDIFGAVPARSQIEGAVSLTSSGAHERAELAARQPTMNSSCFRSRWFIHPRA